MAVAATKREGESSEKLISRWNKKVQAGRMVNWIKRHKFFEKDDNKRKRRHKAIKREFYRTQRNKLSYY
jgi:ribosomal protein S21